MKRLEGSVALVTGASRGIGAATAIELARRGAHVVIVARTVGGLEETDDVIRSEGGEATLLPLDLSEGESVDRIGPSLHARFRRLDILVSNAGVLGRLTPVAHFLPEDWSRTLSINVEAAWRLIRTCQPLLLAAPQGRAVFVTSRTVQRPTAYWGMFGATKAAMEHLAMTWAEETRTTRLRVNLFRPGPVATRLRAEAMPGEDASSLASPHHVAAAIADLCEISAVQHGAIIDFASD